MNLFSQVPIENPGFDIQYQDGIFCLGSCFVSEMGEKLSNSKFQTLINPFGTQFHPLAMENTFSRVYTRTFYSEQEIYRLKDLYFSWDHGHSFSKPNLNQTLNAINESIELGNEFLGKTNVFILTLGTAWAYFLKGGFYVSNCHKVPQKHFEKHLLSTKEVYNALKNLIFMMQDVRPKAHIILTISPVRHTRDGFRENHVSKGVLQQSLHYILKEFPTINYFPSYEIVLDELRDYRFFAEDLIHLNPLGIDYVWDKFKLNYFSESTSKIMDEVVKIQQSLKHKPLNPTGIEHRKFLFDTLKKMESLASDLPQNSLNQEIKELKNRIHVH